MGLTYQIAPDRGWIRCLRCGRTSYSAGDVANLYCGACGFHGTAESPHVTESMCRLLHAVQRGDAGAILPEGPGYTVRMWEALRAQKLVDGTSLTDVGRKALSVWIPSA